MNKHHDLQSSSAKKSGGIGRKILLLFFLILIGTGVVAGIILFETEKPVVSLIGKASHLGKATDIAFKAGDSKSGIRSIVMEIQQKGTVKVLHEKKFPRRSWLKVAGPESVEDKVLFEAAGTGLKDGEAELIITVRDFSLNGLLRGNAAVSRHPVTIDTKPPQVAIKHTQRYIRPGGSGIIVYDLSEPVAKSGVVVNDQFFPGYPIAERENRYLAYIALPWNADQVELSRIVAWDEAGNEGKSVFSMTLKQKKYKSDNINVSDGFLNAKIPEFEENFPESIAGETLIDKFLYVNNDIRQHNALKIMELCSRSEDRQLWQDRFLRMPGQSMAGYAENRTYYYEGKAVDTQVHLGMDIASTASVDIKAANRGKVIFANYLGIYGNTVILDHGQGLFSLYSHLSRIETTIGEVVDQGTVIAYSGATGMAGGDHLHFSIMISGVFVNPLEWLDQHWIEVNIKDILSRL